MVERWLVAAVVGMISDRLVVTVSSQRSLHNRQWPARHVVHGVDDKGHGQRYSAITKKLALHTARPKDWGQDLCTDLLGHVVRDGNVNAAAAAAVASAVAAVNLRVD